MPSDHKQVGIATTCVLLGRQVRQRSNPDVIIAGIEVRDLIIVVIVAIVKSVKSCTVSPCDSKLDRSPRILIARSI